MAEPNTERDPLEMLAAEYMERLRQGQHSSVSEYAAKHPDLAEEIRELFPTIAVTERWKARQARSSGGRATLGPARLERLGDFRIIREIGRGGMGVVFEAEQESLGRRVAVKVLPRQVLLEEKHLKRFQREARIAANLHHTNIVEVFGVGEQDGFHYYVMQYIHGVGLDAIVPVLAKLTGNAKSMKAQREAAQPSAAPAPVAISEGTTAEAAARQLLGGEASRHPDGCLRSHYWQNVARIGLQAANALSYAHSQGTLHRDLKPANLLLDTQGTVWLADFGLAKAAQSDDISLSKDVVGTLRYMAPEQFRGNADRRSDLYSLGLTLYELLALRPAYEEADQSRLIQRIVQGPPAPPSVITPGIPPDLETIILKACSPEPDLRYPSAGAMAADLQCLLEDRPIQARRASPLERLGRWGRRNKALASLAGSTLLLLVLVAGVASVGYLRTKRALRGEALEHAKAEMSANLALQALDRIFERLYPARVALRVPPALAGLQGESLAGPTSPILSKETAALLEEMLPFYDRLAQQTGQGDDLRFRTAEANRRVGAIRQRLGQFEAAVQAYQRALALFRALRPGSPALSSSPLRLAQIQNELGRLFTSQRQAAEARQSHLAALALVQGEAALPSALAAVRFELARTYYFLGTQERPLPAADPRQGERPADLPDEQRDRLAKAVTLLKSLAAAAPVHPEYQHLLALCYLEGAAVEEPDRSEAGGGAERAIGILEGLVQAYPGIPDYAYDLSEAYARIHLPPTPVPRELERIIGERFGKSLALLERLVIQHPDVPDFLAAQARAHDKLGAFHRQRDHWAEAEQSFRRAVGLQGALAQQFPDSPSYGLWMATFRISLADALLQRGQAGEARAELQATIAQLLPQLERKPAFPPPHALLALAYAKLEIAWRQAGEDRLADEAARNAGQERRATRRWP